MNSTKKSTVIDNVICMWWSSLKKVNLEQKIKYWNSKVSAKNQILRNSSKEGAGAGAVSEEESENVTEKKKRKVRNLSPLVKVQNLLIFSKG